VERLIWGFRRDLKSTTVHRTYPDALTVRRRSTAGSPGLRGGDCSASEGSPRQLGPPGFPSDADSFPCSHRRLALFSDPFSNQPAHRSSQDRLSGCVLLDYEAAALKLVKDLTKKMEVVKTMQCIDRGAVEFRTVDCIELC
jgi:hypothetical protein